MKNYMSNIDNRIWLIAIVVVVSIIFVAACSDKQSQYKPRAIGSPGELLIVMDDVYWQSDAGQVLKELLEDEFPALPQSESLFRKTRIAFNQFERHFRTYRNVLLVSIRSNENSNRVEFRKQEWALGQYVAEVIAKTPEEMIGLLHQKWPTLKGFFYNGDISSMADSYKNLYEPELFNYIENAYPFSMYFPKGFRIKKNENQFSWLSSERLGSHLGVFVYQCPLDSAPSIDANNLLQFRNNILRKNVPGETIGSFMTTETQYPVVVNKTKFGGKQWIELRGLWKVQGDFMGGPFVDYFLADESTQQLTMLSGYVYAPAKPKKGIFMREVEAVLKTYALN